MNVSIYTPLLPAASQRLLAASLRVSKPLLLNWTPRAASKAPSALRNRASSSAGKAGASSAIRATTSTNRYRQGLERSVNSLHEKVGASMVRTAFTPTTWHHLQLARTRAQRRGQRRDQRRGQRKSRASFLLEKAGANGEISVTTAMMFQDHLHGRVVRLLPAQSLFRVDHLQLRVVRPASSLPTMDGVSGARIAVMPTTASSHHR